MNKLKLFFVILIVFLFNSSVKADELLDLTSDMAKLNQYLPAIDLLNTAIEKDKNNYDYWFNLGLYYVHSKQLNNAINAFDTANKIKPSKRLKIRINNLKFAISNIGDIDIVNLKTDSEKASWLLLESASLLNKKNEESFRLFIQAFEYDHKIIKKRKEYKEYINTGLKYYKDQLEKKAKYSQLYYAIYKYFEDDITEASKQLEAFKKDNPQKSPAIQKMADYYSEIITLPTK